MKCRKSWISAKRDYLAREYLDEGIQFFRPGIGLETYQNGPI